MLSMLLKSCTSNFFPCGGGSLPRDKGGVRLPACGGCGHTLGRDLSGLSLSRRVTDNVDIVDIEQNMIYYKETIDVLKNRLYVVEHCFMNLGYMK